MLRLVRLVPCLDLLELLLREIFDGFQTDPDSHSICMKSRSSGKCRSADDIRLENSDKRVRGLPRHVPRGWRADVCLDRDPIEEWRVYNDRGFGPPAGRTSCECNLPGGSPRLKIRDRFDSDRHTGEAPEFLRRAPLLHQSRPSECPATEFSVLCRSFLLRSCNLQSCISSKTSSAIHATRCHGRLLKSLVLSAPGPARRRSWARWLMDL